MNRILRQKQFAAMSVKEPKIQKNERIKIKSNGERERERERERETYRHSERGRERERERERELANMEPDISVRHHVKRDNQAPCYIKVRCSTTESPLKWSFKPNYA